MDRNLLTFLTVAETENITAAAARLNITQPTLSKRLQLLELAYDCKLIERLPRGVRLTKFGQQLLPYAKRISQEYSQAQEAISLVKTGHLAKLNVGAGPLFHLRYLASAFQRLRAEFPETTIHITADLNSRNLPKLRAGGMHIVFGTVEDLEEDDQIFFDPISTVEQGLVLRKQHPLKNATVQASDLVGIPWIIYSDTSEHEALISSYFEALGLPAPKIVLQTTSFSLGLQMVRENDYAMNLPVQLEPTLGGQDLRVLRLFPRISEKAAGAFTRRSSKQYPIVARLIEIVREAADETKIFKCP